jgi:hypothetical protein
MGERGSKVVPIDEFPFKGSVQGKLSWVKKCQSMDVVLRLWRWAECFFCKESLHLVFDIFPFPVRTVQLIGEFWNNR